MKRLLTVVTGQPLVNFIAVRELEPDVVHCLYTPRDKAMAIRLESLQAVVGRHLPMLRWELHPMEDPYDSASAWRMGFEALNNRQGDDWYLNRTSGTEQMRLPLAAVFEKCGLQEKTFFVETEKSQISYWRPNWINRATPFRHCISVLDYFDLHGQRITSAPPQNSTEEALFNQLKGLQFDEVVSSCSWRKNNRQIAEYDIVATAGYRLFMFERKRLQSVEHHILDLKRQGNNSAQQLEGKSKAIRERIRADVLHDVEKLAYSRSLFGGPLGSVYWVLSGSYEPDATMLERMRELGIRYINGEQIGQLNDDPTRFGLPARRGK